MVDVVRRKLLQGTALAGGLAAARSLFPAPAIAQIAKGTGEVVVYDGGGSWGEAKRIAYFEPFEKETGIKVIAQPRTDTGAVRASVLAGAPRYDVTILPGGKAPTFERDNLLLPIDYGYFDKADLDSFSPVKVGKFTVPAIIYSLFIAYDASKFTSNAPNTWADVWDAQKYAGRRSLMAGTWASDGGTFEAALMADGVDPSKLYPLDWDRAFKSLSRVKPSILKWWNTGAEAPQMIIDKLITAGSAWNGRVSAANEQGAKIGYTWNQGMLQYDTWVVLKGTKNADNAFKFLAFSARAENQAKFVQHILYAPPNSRAFEHVPSERAKLLPTSPEARKLQFVQDYEFWNTVSSNGKANNEIAVAQWERWISGVR
ncbi:putative spermidine/putrescine transport system substrate-binding protein [Bradyrhizobium sp. Rc3b]|uniref:ABC transporter substrate-binding protein n=1 Tax=Bradyrhizobium sp. Rc3b TaxID=1855322 RepID=UPI0008EAB61A|nr:ABC transporter substrate-binding protein [Bradyrhizobium sp. Rc3b]SFN78023.1 putative spermidine/putrescine transport system substrate-binding protein [Bradyrhizobium sp. Rc3b]